MALPAPIPPQNLQPTIAGPPATASVASQILSLMAALSGTLTDYNQGSQIRTIAESIGSVEEMQGIWSTTLAFQTLVYSALALFNVQPGFATAATGTVTFATSVGVGPPPPSQNVPIALGTIVQTIGGVQFQTTSAVALGSGSGAVDAPVAALLGGTGGNLQPQSIIQIITGLSYPLVCYNASATTGGANAQSTSVSLSQFAATVASIGRSSPVAIANAAIGVNFNNEAVQYSTLYEPWIAAGAASGSGLAGWTLFIDNGSGTASSGLIANVTSVLNGGASAGTANASGAIGYRDAGVPFGVSAVTPTLAIVGVTGVAIPGNSDTVISGEIVAAISAYFTLPFGATAQQAQISTAISNATLGQLSALNVQLQVSGASAVVTGVTPPISGRVTLGALNMTLS